VLEAVENLSATPGLAEGGACAKAVAGLLLPALADLVGYLRTQTHLSVGMSLDAASVWTDVDSVW